MRASKRSTVEEKRESKKKTKKKNTYQHLSATFVLGILGKHSWHITKEFKYVEQRKKCWSQPECLLWNGEAAYPCKVCEVKTHKQWLFEFFTKENQKEKKKRRPWPRKYFLLHLLLGLQGNISRGPIKSEPQSRQWVVASRRSKSSK